MQKELNKATRTTTTKPAATNTAQVKTQVQEMMAVITAFSNLLKKETAALKKADFKTVDTLQADKKLFAKQYHAKVSALAELREEFAKIDVSLREKLAEEREKFSLVLKDNMQALEMAQNSTKRLVDRILDAARQAVTKEHETNYSNAGKTVTYKSVTKSLSVDRSL